MKTIKFVLFVLGLNIIFLNTAETQTLKKAAVTTDKGIETNPDNLHKHYIDQGLYYFEQNQLGKAKYFFYKAKELNPEKADSYINMAAIAMQRKNFEKAIMILEKSLKLADETKQDVIFCN
jgi:Tfp pilus assembly protein PilF